MRPLFVKAKLDDPGITVLSFAVSKRSVEKPERISDSVELDSELLFRKVVNADCAAELASLLLNPSAAPASTASPVLRSKTMP